MSLVALLTLCLLVNHRTLNNNNQPNFLIDMKLKDLKRIGTFNCQGLVTSEAKQRMLADDFERKKH